MLNDLDDAYRAHNEGGLAMTIEDYTNDLLAMKIYGKSRCAMVAPTGYKITNRWEFPLQHPELLFFTGVLALSGSSFGNVESPRVVVEPIPQPRKVEIEVTPGERLIVFETVGEPRRINSNEFYLGPNGKEIYTQAHPTVDAYQPVRRIEVKEGE